MTLRESSRIVFLERRVGLSDEVQIRPGEGGSIDLRRLRFFVFVAEELSFSRAARRAGLSQQALSSQVRSLEEEVGRVLFFRTTRRVELTPAGKALLPKARMSLRAASEALASARAAVPDPRYDPLS